MFLNIKYFSNVASAKLMTTMRLFEITLHNDIFHRPFGTEKLKAA